MMESRAKDGFAELRPLDPLNSIEVRGVSVPAWCGFLKQMEKLYGRKLADHSVEAIRRHLAAAEAIFMVLPDVPPTPSKKRRR